MNQNDSIETFIESEFKHINRLATQRRLSDALNRCLKIFGIYPNNPRVLQGLGILRFRTGEPDEGERLLKSAIDLDPEYADAYFNLGMMLRNSCRFDEAESLYRKALELDPLHYKALSSLAFILTKKKRFQEANECCIQAIKINPRYSNAYENLGYIMGALGHLGESVRLHRKALSFRNNEAAHSSLLFSLNALYGVSQPEIFSEAKIWGKKYLRSHIAVKCHLNSPIKERRIRIGYVSGDFKYHPVGYHLKPVFAAHDSSVVEIYMYNTFPNTDELTVELSEYSYAYRDISSMSDDDAERIIRDDNIDILVDLSGHTAFHRMHLFSRKPAPVQATWIGFFNTTGVPAIDYIISDPITIPIGQDDLFVEKVTRLPNCRFCYSPPTYAPEIASLAAQKLGYITFGSFNKIAKINAETIILWCKIMSSISGSRLILKATSLEDDSLKNELARQFENHGIPRNRIDFRSDTPHPEMLAEYGDVDIALDTYPFNGGATTCEALWMGVPVVTLEGEIPISRQSKAFLHTIGHPEWVASSVEDYIKIALNLASDLKTLSKIRKKLRMEMNDSPLCDGHSFAKDLEKLYRQMWCTWCDTYSSAATLEPIKKISVEVVYNAGVTSMTDNDYQHAIQLFQEVLRRKPRHSLAANNLGICLFQIGSTIESVHSFKRAIRHDKQFCEAYSNLGKVLVELGLFRDAIKACTCAVRLQPNHINSLINLGNSYREVGKINEAYRSYQRVLEIDHRNVDALKLMSSASLACGDVDAAIDLLKKALKIQPQNISVISSLIFNSQYSSTTTQKSIFKLSRKYVDNIKISTSIKENNFFELKVPFRKSKLNVGFVSADFKSHPVGMLLVSLFKNNNNESMALYCYNNGRKNDGITDYYRLSAYGWREIAGLSDDEAEQLIKKDGIDILVDLSGHTDGNRLQMFSRRIAPVQASWLGYGHTTGLETMDYIIADDDLIRKNDERWFSEKIIRLPHGRFCFTPPSTSPEVVELPFNDNGYITFGCFNNLAKVSLEVVDVWANVLHSIPRSRLILKSKYFVDASVREKYRIEFKKRGISPRRLELRNQSGYYLMLCEYGDVDIALDPFPFSGGMTSLEALWMGVPVITLPGELPISRQTSSFLKQIGLSSLIASNKEEYVRISSLLAKDYSRLDIIRTTLREYMLNSPLCYGRSYADSLNNAFIMMTRCAQTLNKGLEL